MYAWLLVLSVLVFAAMLAIYLRHPAASVFHPVTWYLMFHALVFVVRPVFGWYYGYDNIYQEIGFRPSEWERSQVLICTSLGLIAFVAVGLRFANQPLPFRQDAADLDERARLLRRFWVVAVPLGVLAASSLHWQWNAVAQGGYLHFRDPLTGESALTVSNGYFLSLGWTLVPITATIAFLARFRWWSLLPFAGFAVLALGTGNRGHLAAAVVMLALLLLFDRKRKWPGFLLVAGALALVPAFHALQKDRGTFVRESFRPAAEDWGRRTSYEGAPLESMDIANMEFFEYLVWAVPKRTGSHDWFLNNLQLFTEPVPRALWPDKPVGPPVKLFDLYEETRPIGITFSVPGMGWYNAGYAGVVLWCALFALIYGGTYRWLARGPQANLTVLGYAVVLSTAPIGFRDGSLVTLAKLLLFYGAPIALLALAAGYWPAGRGGLRTGGPAKTA